MKKLIGYFGSYLLFYLGEVSAFLMHIKYLHNFYSVYNFLMAYSYAMQEWAGNDKPWTKVN